MTKLISIFSILLLTLACTSKVDITSSTRIGVMKRAVSSPEFSLPSGKYYSNQSVSITSATEGATILYTMDGTNPTSSSSVYSSALTISETTTLKAIAIKTDYSDSTVTSADYTINIITPVNIMALPDTSNYKSVTWTPKVSFDMTTSDTIGLYSDTSGTLIHSNSSLPVGRSILSGNSVTAQGSATNVYAKAEGSSSYVSLGQYTTDLPLSHYVNGVMGIVFAIAKDTSSAGCSVASPCFYIAGQFSGAGNTGATNIVKFKSSDESWSPLGTGVNGNINAVAMDSSGNVYVGGDFTTAGGIAAKNIAKWNGSAWSALGSGANALVKSLAFGPGNVLYVVGYFSQIAGVSAAGVARFDGTTWTALGSGLGPPGLGNALAVNPTNGDIYVGGNFTTAGGISASQIAKWNGTTWSALGSGANNGITALLHDGTNLYAGGYFSSVGGITTKGIASWNGTIWSAMGSGLSNSSGSSPSVYSLTSDGSGNILAGGQFDRSGATVLANTAKWNGSSWTALGTAPSLVVWAIAASSNGIVYAGGYNLNSDVLPGVWKWNGTSWVGVTSKSTNAANNKVYSIVKDIVSTASGCSAAQPCYYIAGSFTQFGSLSANRIVKYKTSDGTISALGSGLDATVRAMVVSPTGDLYVGGDFTMAGGTSAPYVAKWNGSTWSTLGAGAISMVNASLLHSNGNLYVGTAAGVSVWNGATWSELPVELTVTALAIDSAGNIYAGGSGNNDDVWRNGIAKWNGATWSDLADGLDGQVLSLAMAADGTLYAAGVFSASGAKSMLDVAQWNGTSWSAVGTGLGDVGATNAAVNVLGFDPSGSLYAAGDFTASGTTSINRFAKWNGTSWVSVGARFNKEVYTFCAGPNGEFFLGGAFGSANDKGRPYFVRYISWLEDFF